MRPAAVALGGEGGARQRGGRGQRRIRRQGQFGDAWITLVRPWGHGVMGSWGHGVMGSWGHGVMGDETLEMRLSFGFRMGFLCFERVLYPRVFQNLQRLWFWSPFLFGNRSVMQSVWGMFENTQTHTHTNPVSSRRLAIEDLAGRIWSHFFLSVGEWWGHARLPRSPNHISSQFCMSWMDLWFPRKSEKIAAAQAMSTLAAGVASLKSLVNLSAVPALAEAAPVYAANITCRIIYSYLQIISIMNL